MLGAYFPRKEARLEYNGREVLYVAGMAVAQYSYACCGPIAWDYAIVPGYIVKWQYKTSEAGLPVSEVEPVSDRVARDSIRRLVREKEPFCHIEFW